MSNEIHDEVVLQKVREVIGDLVAAGTPPIVVAYSLVYSAVELGLLVESDAKRVLSTLLGAMALATQKAVPDSNDGAEADCDVPRGVTRQ
jgi:hypothetical protein